MKFISPFVLLLAAFLTLMFTNAHGQWVQKGLDVDGTAASMRFGHGTSLSSDGNTFASGAPDSGGAGSSSGHVRVIDWNSNTNSWEQRGANINGDSSGDKFGYSVSISADGNTVAIGAPQNDASGLSAGNIKVYEWNTSSNSWEQKGLDLVGQAQDDQFGWSLSLSDDGNTLIGGARYSSSLGWGTGHARVYQWNTNSSTWEQKGSDLYGESAGSNAGFSTSINAEGSIVAVGSPYESNGQVKVYSWSENTSDWVQLGSTLFGDQTDDDYGYSIDLNFDGEILAIGSKGDCQTGYNAGHTRVYQFNNNTSSWEQMGQAMNGESEWDFSGYSVSLNDAGNTLAVGALSNDGNGVDSGHLRVFDWDGGLNSWTQRATDIDGEAAGDQFGWSVSLSADGNVVAGGSNTNSDNGSEAGHVRVFEFLSTASISAHDMEIKIYPNPFSEKIIIDIYSEGEVSVNLYDAEGRTVATETIWTNGQSEEFNVEDLEEGFYTITIESSNGKISRKLVKH